MGRIIPGPSAGAGATHAGLPDVTANQHHTEAHAIGAAGPHTGLLDHPSLDLIGPDDHHAQTHSHASHSGIGADDHHARAHDHSAAGDGTTLNAARLRATAPDDATLASTLHGFQVGPTAGLNVIADGNEVQARNAGAASTLNLQASGGTTFIGDTLTCNGIHRDSGVITPAALAANTNDYGPAGGVGAYVWRVSASTPGFDLTGIAGPVAGDQHLLVNVGTFPIFLRHESALSTAANRFRCPGGRLIALYDRAAVAIFYDGTLARWCVIYPEPTVPSGAIIMWSGTVAAIPSGWLFCDGTNGTPDLRDRMLVGAASGNENTSGGTVSATAALATHGTHAGHSAHAFTQPSAHTITINNGTTTTATASGTGALPANASHTHTNSLTNNHAGGAVDAHSAHGAHDGHAVLNYYRLAYIMKA